MTQEIIHVGNVSEIGTFLQAGHSVIEKLRENNEKCETKHSVSV